MKPQVPEGLHVRYQHIRPSNSPRGGYTVAMVYNDQRVVVAQAVAMCHDKDNYCKRIGRDISLGRALKKLKQSPAQV